METPALVSASAVAPGLPGEIFANDPAMLKAETTALRSLIHHRGFVQHEETLERVHKQFSEAKVEFLALVRDGRVTGLCSRMRLGILLGSRFGFALHSRSPAHLAQVEHSLVITDNTPVREVLTRALGRQSDEFHEDVVLVDSEHRLIGLVSVDALARLQSRLVSEQVDELRRGHLELFKANHALRQSQGLYLGLFEGHTLGVALLDDQGGVHEHNRRLVELLNFGSEPVAIVSLVSWVTESERTAFMGMLEMLKSGAAPTAREFTLLIPGRGTRLFRISCGWIRETSQICACLDDITEQRTLERHMVRQEKQTLLDTLVGGIAHELNNKLTPVQGFSELLCLAADQQTKQYAKLITKSVTEAAGIIRQLLQMSKPNAPLTQLFDLRQVVEEALSMLRFQFRESRCKTAITLAPGPVWVRADAAQIKQVVLNLMINALHAVKDQAEPMLAVEVGEKYHAASLVVADNGVGIPPENLNRIFDPFFTTKGPEHGTGLGLSICFSIVRQHGGDIDVTSKPGAGARFTVSLPLETTVPSALEAAALTGTTPPFSPSGGGTRVLVVDDEIVVSRLLQEILTVQYKCRVDLAAHGLEAMERLTTERYSLVISDIRMPYMSGTELFLWLRQAQPDSARRFVFVTGHAGEKHLEAEIAQWGIPVLAKPFTMARFAEVCSPYLIPTGAASTGA